MQYLKNGSFFIELSPPFFLEITFLCVGDRPENDLLKSDESVFPTVITTLITSLKVELDRTKIFSFLVKQ